jgi:small subunit ribosomal protein S16
MAVRIRLTRVGATKQPTYRVVVADSRSARDGRSIETIGHYNPRTEPIEIVIDADKAKRWLAQGATPSHTVERLFRSAGILPAAK